MFELGTSLQDIAGMIEAAGVTAVTDPRDLNLPGAWVTPGTISFETLDTNTALMRFDVYLITGDQGTTVALNELGGMLAKVRPALQVPEALPVMVNLPNHGADALPALLISIDAQLSED